MKTASLCQLAGMQENDIDFAVVATQSERFKSMWKEKSKSAMTLFCGGDEDGAIASWKEALANASPTNSTERAEVAEINYCIGKCFADQKKDANAAFYLREAAEQFASIDANHNRLGVIQNTLARVLQNMGKEDEATSLYQTVKGIVPDESLGIDLRTAVKHLQKQKLARDLNLSQLKRICKELEINIDGNNRDIEAILFAYYWDEKHGADRSGNDLMMITDYTQFTTDSFCEYLNSLIGHPGFIMPKQAKQFEPYAAINFVTHDGKDILKACASAVAIIDLFNAEMEELEMPELFRTLEYDPCLMAYLMTDAVFETLQEQQALNFD